MIDDRPDAGVNVDEWDFNSPGDTAQGVFADLREIRVSLVARTIEPRPFGSP